MTDPFLRSRTDISEFLMYCEYPISNTECPMSKWALALLKPGTDTCTSSRVQFPRPTHGTREQGVCLIISREHLPVRVPLQLAIELAGHGAEKTD